MKKLLSILLFLALVFSSCESHVVEDSSTCDPDISFAQDVNPIMVASCLECHSGTRFPDLRTHDNINSNATIIKSEVVTRSMPQGSTLSDEQIELISCWIDNGALDN